MRRRKKSAIPAALPMVWWWDLATRSTEMLTASAEVIFHRSVRMGSMSNPPSAHDRGELSTMVTEKVAASQQSAAAMMVAASSAASKFWLNQWMAGAVLASRKTPSLTEAVASASQTSAKILTAGMQPYRQRAMSNAKRLRKPRPKR